MKIERKGEREQRVDSVLDGGNTLWVRPIQVEPRDGNLTWSRDSLVRTGATCTSCRKFARLGGTRKLVWGQLSKSCGKFAVLGGTPERELDLEHISSLVQGPPAQVAESLQE